MCQVEVEAMQCSRLFDNFSCFGDICGQCKRYGHQHYSQEMVEASRNIPLKEEQRAKMVLEKESLDKLISECSQKEPHPSIDTSLAVLRLYNCKLALTINQEGMLKFRAADMSKGIMIELIKKFTIIKSKLQET